MSTRPKLVSEALREAIRKSDVSCYRICIDLDIAEATMSRFMTGKGGLRMGHVDDICEYLGLELVSSGKATRNKGRK